MIEEWRDIDGYEGLYQISSFGRVKSFHNQYNIAEKILATPSNEDGYPTVCLSIGQQQNKFRVHRLVAKAFLDSLENKPQVNHIDGNRSNNVISNLEWVTNKENVQHSFTVLERKSSGGHKGKRGKNHHASIKVKATNVFTGETQTFDGMKDAERKLTGVSARKISEVCSKKRKTHQGFYWEKC